MNFFEAMAFVNSLSSSEKDRLLSLQTAGEVVSFAAEYGLILSLVEGEKALSYINKYRDR